MPIIETDPRVQALFDENTANMRRANAEITATLKSDQDRLAADARAREEKLAAAQSELAKQSAELVKAGDKPKKPQWDRPERPTGASEMSFGPEDEEEQPPQAVTPPPPPPPAPTPPPARPAPRRPAPADDDDDMSGQTWLS